VCPGEEEDPIMRRAGGLLLVLLLVSCCTGCRAMLYPAARAFGVPKESEMKVSRQAFAAMTAEIRGGSVVVFPTLVTDFGGKPVWDTEATSGAAEILRRELCPSAVATTEIPGVPDQPLERNELRHQTRRGRAYAAWVASRRPSGDRFVFTEVYRDPATTRIVGGLIFVVDASARLAYSRHFDSHFFDPASVPSIDAFLEWMLKEFLGDLQRKPTEIFPPWGVG
jgi:hypothetical protein